MLYNHLLYVFTAKLLYLNNNTTISLSLNIVEVLDLIGVTM
jgi:hypothetical protein